jgi:uncharacterized protein YoaH (UPF0181 family)
VAFVKTMEGIQALMAQGFQTGKAMCCEDYVTQAITNYCPLARKDIQ